MTDNDVPAAVPATTDRAARPGALKGKRELFAQRFAALGNATEAYRRTYRRTGSSPNSLRVRAYAVAHDPAVAARVRQLLAVAVGDSTVATQARMARLQAIVEADPAELVRVERVPCAHCWLPESPPADGAGGDAAPPQGDQNALREYPRADCSSCHGDGSRRVVVTPTDELSPAARMLLQSIRQKSTGEIEVRLHDQLAAADQLNRMQGSYAPERSVAVAAHVSVDFARMTRDEQLQFLDSLRPVHE
ncbi:MAG: terminase small subunit [Steroidobacteraceae bacterium]